MKTTMAWIKRLSRRVEAKEIRRGKKLSEESACIIAVACLISLEESSNGSVIFLDRIPDKGSACIVQRFLDQMEVLRTFKRN